MYVAPTSSDGKGAVWVKLFEQNYDGGSWAVDKLIAQRGKHSIIIPDLQGKQYLKSPRDVSN